MSLLTYLIKSCLFQAVAYLGYQWFLDREPLGHLKRTYLLVSLVLSLTVPLVPVGNIAPEVVPVFPAVPVEVVTSPMPMPVAQEPKVTEPDAMPPAADVAPPPAPAPVQTPASFPLTTVLWWAYGLITLLAFGRFLSSLLPLVRQLRRGTVMSSGAVRLVALPHPVAPHTFLRWVFYFGASPPGRDVLAHERAHARQLHSLDRLFVGLLRVLFWWNPLLLLFERAIRHNHELLADRAVLDAGFSTYTYQKNLLHALTPGQPTLPALASAADFNLTKKRFTMMYQNPTSRTQRIVRGLLAAGLWAILIVGFGDRLVAQDPPPPPPSPPSAPAAAPPAPTAPRLIKLPVLQPTTEQLLKWQNPTEYGVWLDGKRIDNDRLADYQPKDFGYYFVSKLYRNAKNYGQHTYQVDLSTLAYHQAQPPLQLPPDNSSRSGLRSFGWMSFPLPGTGTKATPQPVTGADLARWRADDRYTIRLNYQSVANGKLAEYTADDFEPAFGQVTADVRRGVSATIWLRTKEQAGGTPPPPPPLAVEMVPGQQPRSQPSTDQLVEWRDGKTYGIWLNGEEIANEELKNYAPEDFAHWSSYKFPKRAKNYGRFVYGIELFTVERVARVEAEARRLAGELGLE